MAKNQSRFISIFICLFLSTYQYNSVAQSTSSNFSVRKSIYKVTRTLVNKEEVDRENRGVGGVDLVIDLTKLYKYKKRPYCAATVKYCIEKSGHKVPLDVENPLAARSWFKEDIIYKRGKYHGMYKERIKLCDFIGFYTANSITHIGFYLWELGEGGSKTFEGNTSKPGNRKVEGFFDKRRKLNYDVIVRQLRVK